MIESSMIRGLDVSFRAMTSSFLAESAAQSPYRSVDHPPQLRQVTVRCWVCGVAGGGGFRWSSGCFRSKAPGANAPVHGPEAAPVR